MKELIVCVVTVFLLTGCEVTVDPLGITERTQIRAGAAVSIAAEERKAEEAKAQALVNAEIARQAGLKQRNANVVMMIPFVVLIVVAGVCVALVINWRGKLAMAQVQRGLPAQPTHESLPVAIRQSLESRGWRGEYDRGNWWAVNEHGQRLEKPFTHLLEVKR